MKILFSRKVAFYLSVIIVLILAGCASKLNSEINPINTLNPVKTTQNQISTLAPTMSPTPYATATMTSTPVPTSTLTPTVTPNQIKTPKAVPILYYHAVNDDVWGMAELFVSPKEFEKQMEFLKNNGYTVITFAEIPSANNIQKPIIITFDDGYEDNYTYMYPILKKYNYKATIFLVNDYIDKSAYLKKNQILEMRDLINFQGHTITHPYLTTLKDSDVEYELSQSQILIEGITGMKVNVLAYPIGDYNQRIINITKKYYTYGVLNGGGMYYTGDSNYEMKRIYVPRNLTIEGFEAKIKATK